jgi:malate dehydrogenase
MGVLTLDTVRAKAFISEKLNCDVNKVNVMVIGGHSGKTILPLLSNVEVDNCKLDDLAQSEVIQRVRYAGEEVIAAKDGLGSATLSMVTYEASIAPSTTTIVEGLLLI